MPAQFEGAAGGPDNGTRGRAWSLSELLLRVDEHPELAMQRAEIEAAESRIATRSSLSDPSLIVGVQNLPTNFSFNQDPMTAKVIGIGQEFPFPGKLGKERSIGEFSAESSRASLAEKRNMLRRDVKLAWYEIVHRRRSLAAYTDHLGILDLLEKEVGIAISGGKTPVSEAQRIELERAEILQMMTQERSLIAMQYAKLGYDIGKDVQRISQVDSLPFPAFTYSMDSLARMASRNRPYLKEIDAAIGGADAAVERSKLDRYPDFDVMLMYMQKDALAPIGGATGYTPQMNMISAQLTVTLPLNYNGKNDARIAEMDAMRNVRIAEKRMAERTIRSEVAERLARLEELRTTYGLLQSSSIPSLQSVVQALAIDYRFDRASLQSILTQELTLLHKQHDLYEEASEYYKAIAEIEFLVGTDLIPITN
jgi:outer membrane protein TolC